MADAIVEAVDGRVTVVVQGNELLTGYVEAAAGEADRGLGYANQVQSLVVLAQAAQAAAAGSATLAALAAQTAPNVYATVSAGLAATASGSTFWVQGDGEILLYRDNAGVADLLFRYGRGHDLTLSSYGAVPNMRQTLTAAITNGSNTLTIPGAAFSSADLGKTVVVGTASANRHIATIDAILSATQVTMSAAPSVTLNPTGAAWGTDCTGPLQAAIDDLTTKHGGRLVIDGKYLLSGAVTKNLLNAADHIQIVGYGGNSVIAVSGATGTSSIAFQNAARLTISDVNFVGTPNLSHDTARVIDLSQCNVSFRDCGFWGLAAAFADNAIVYTYECDLEMTDCRFGGTVTASANNTSTVECMLWRRLNFTRCRWVDYGQFDGILHSKTGFFIPLGWIHVGSTSGPDIDALGQGVARITDCRGDEGAFAGIFADPGMGGHLGRIVIDGWEANVHGSDGGQGIHIANAINVEITRCAFGYVATLADAIWLDSCANVLIDQCEAADGATRMTASTIAQLTVKNSPTIATRVLSAVARYDQGERMALRLPNVAGGGIAAGAYYTQPITGIDCTRASVMVSVLGNGEGGAADRYKVGHQVLNRTATGCDVRIHNFGAAGQTIDADINVIN